MKYIPADKLIAEIERQIEETKSMKPSFDQFWAGQISAFKGAIKIAESLHKEQPEVDLEKEIECSIRFLNGHHILENGERWYKGRYEELRDFARHFYELGLNARKNE